METRHSPTAGRQEQRRWQALELKREGWIHQEVAEVLGVPKGAVSQWMKRVAQEGEAGLYARPRPGAIPKLTAEEKARLPELLSLGAPWYGFRGEFWTCNRVREVIRREFQVSYHKDHVRKLLKACGWTRQKPLTRAAQRDEAAIARWRTQIWPKLKKKRPGSSGRRSLLMKRRFICCLASSEPMRRAARHLSCAGC
jgi:transposase